MQSDYEKRSSKYSIVNINICVCVCVREREREREKERKRERGGCGGYLYTPYPLSGSARLNRAWRASRPPGPGQRRRGSRRPRAPARRWWSTGPSSTRPAATPRRVAKLACGRELGRGCEGGREGGRDWAEGGNGWDTASLHVRPPATNRTAGQTSLTAGRPAAPAAESMLWSA